MSTALPALFGCVLLVGAVTGRRYKTDALARRTQAALWRIGLVLGIPVIAAAPIQRASLAVMAGAVAFSMVTLLAWGHACRSKLPAPERAAFTLSVLWPNTGALGIPLCLVLLGPAAVPTAALYGSLVAGPLSLLLGGVVAKTRDGKQSKIRLVANPALFALVIGLLWALLPVPGPGRLTDWALWSIVAMSLVAFFSAGLWLGRAPLSIDRHVATALLFRLGVSPALLMSATVVVAVPRAFLLQAAMSTGLSTFSVASAHRLPMARVAATFAWSTGIVLAVALLIAVVT